MSGQEDADHVVPELLLAQRARLTCSNHPAAEVVGAEEGIMRVVCVRAHDGVAELVREAGDLPAGPSATRKMQEVEEGEVEEDWFEDFLFHGELERV